MSKLPLKNYSLKSGAHSMSKSLPGCCRKPGLTILILTCLAALLLFPYIIIHNGFNDAQQLLDEFVAYSGLGRLAALNLRVNDGNWQPQKIAAAAAEPVNQEPEPASPAKASSTTPQLQSRRRLCME